MKTEKKKCGFAVIPAEQLKKISSLGGKAAHAAGTAHEFTRAEAIEAGRKGGFASRRKKLLAA